MKSLLVISGLALFLLSGCGSSSKEVKAPSDKSSFKKNSSTYQQFLGHKADKALDKELDKMDK